MSWGHQLLAASQGKFGARAFSSCGMPSGGAHTVAPAPWAPPPPVQPPWSVLAQTDPPSPIPPTDVCCFFGQQSQPGAYCGCNSPPTGPWCVDGPNGNQPDHYQTLEKSLATACAGTKYIGSYKPPPQPTPAPQPSPYYPPQPAPQPAPQPSPYNPPASIAPAPYHHPPASIAPAPYHHPPASIAPAPYHHPPASIVPAPQPTPTPQPAPVPQPIPTPAAGPCPQNPVTVPPSNSRGSRYHLDLAQPLGGGYGSAQCQALGFPPVSSSVTCDMLPAEYVQSCKTFAGMYWDNPVVSIKEWPCPPQLDFDCGGFSGNFPATCPTAPSAQAVAGAGAAAPQPAPRPDPEIEYCYYYNNECDGHYCADTLGGPWCPTSAQSNGPGFMVGSNNGNLCVYPDGTGQAGFFKEAPNCPAPASAAKADAAMQPQRSAAMPTYSPLLPPLPPLPPQAPMDSCGRFTDPENYATTTRYYDCEGGACGCGYEPAEGGPPVMCPWNAFGNPGSIPDPDVPGGVIQLGTAAVSQQLFGSTGWMGAGCGKCYLIESTGQCGQMQDLCAFLTGPDGQQVILPADQLPPALQQYANQPIPLNLFGAGKKAIVKATNQCPDQPQCPLGPPYPGPQPGPPAGPPVPQPPAGPPPPIPGPTPIPPYPADGTDYCYFFDNTCFNNGHYCNSQTTKNAEGVPQPQPWCTPAPNGNSGTSFRAGSNDPNLCVNGYFVENPCAAPEPAGPPGPPVPATCPPVVPACGGVCPIDCGQAYESAVCLEDLTTVPGGKLCCAKTQNSDGSWTALTPEVCGRGTIFSSWNQEATDFFTPKGSSTHYGNQRNGACGFQAASFCSNKFTYIDPDSAKTCEIIPDDLKASPISGFYAAPSGYYYTQVGPDGSSTYLSCGECYEIVVDTEFTPNYVPSAGSGSVVVQIADSCPGAPNIKWCAGEFSARPDIPKLGAGSLHLDLNDASLGVLTAGDPNAFAKGLPNVLPFAATKYRRVPCPITTAMYLALAYVSFQTPVSTQGFYSMGFGVTNVAGAGSLFKVEMQGSPEPPQPPPPGAAPGPAAPTGKYCYQFSGTCTDQHSCTVQPANPNWSCPGTYSDNPNLCIPVNAPANTPQFFAPACAACPSFCGLPSIGADGSVGPPSSEGVWVNCPRGTDVTETRPQEEYGIWQLNSQLFAPVRLRITDSKNRVIVTDWIPYDSFTHCNSTTTEGCYIKLTTNNGAGIAQYPATL